MAGIIHIETSTDLCSAALSVRGQIVAYRESREPRAHASLTAVFVDEILRQVGLRVSDCDAVCVARGPGSYTGLRVGVSTAKGLCFGGGIPLISVGTLETLVWQHLAGSRTDRPDKEAVDYKYIIPMVDARRMEVYTQIFSPSAEPLTGPEALIVEPGSFASRLSEGPVLFIGDAADKCRTVLRHPNAHFCQCSPKASSMLVPAERALAAARFEDVAYFEPFYLKQFVATVSRKKLF